MTKNKKKSGFKEKNILFVSYLYKTKDGRVNWCSEQFANTKNATDHFNNHLKQDGAKLLGFKPNSETIYVKN